MTSGPSDQLWLNLAGSEPDLYYSSAESALSGSLRTPEEGDLHAAVVQQLSSLSINGPTPDRYRNEESIPRQPVWRRHITPASDVLVPPKQFLPPEHFRSQARQPSFEDLSFQHDAADFDAHLMADEAFRRSTQRIQPNLHFTPSAFECFADAPAQMESSASYVHHPTGYPADDDAMERQIEQAFADQDKLFAALRSIQSDVRYVHAELEDLQSNQSEYAEDVAQMWEARPKFLPLN